ncbi:M23 family metallopeptidase [Pigmentiphaga soli]|uniref:M23 family metallopeptidase n=1 Tax=Pigmentiphaga soli TaxID=1007095 RepID=A0ABP8HQ43_9BURK
MQIIIVHPRLQEARTLNVTPRIAAAAAVSLAALLVLAAIVLQGVGSRLGLSWLGGTPAHAVADARRQQQQQAFLRDNMHLLARRVGEMQAKLMQLDALGERVAGLAGVSPAFNFKQAAGRGGLLVAPHEMSPQEVGAELDKLETQLAERSDYLSVLDAQLTTLSVRRSMTPTVLPVDHAYNGSSFGWRVDPFTGARALHEGIDFVAPAGTPIVAAAGGVVVAAEYHSGYGYMVDIDHGNDLITRYAHTSRLLVKTGDLVRRGQRIALVGSTGRSTGSHLHFEVRISGVAVDPNRFLARGPANAPLLPAPAIASGPAPLD